jgi:hypothetical protein
MQWTQQTEDQLDAELEELTEELSPILRRIEGIERGVIGKPARFKGEDWKLEKQQQLLALRTQADPLRKRQAEIEDILDEWEAYEREGGTARFEDPDGDPETSPKKHRRGGSRHPAGADQQWTPRVYRAPREARKLIWRHVNRAVENSREIDQSFIDELAELVGLPVLQVTDIVDSARKKVEAFPSVTDRDYAHCGIAALFWSAKRHTFPGRAPERDRRIVLGAVSEAMEFPWKAFGGPEGGFNLSTRDWADRIGIPHRTTARGIVQIEKWNEGWFYRVRTHPSRSNRTASLIKLGLGPEPDLVRARWTWLWEHRQAGWEWEAKGMGLIDPAWAATKRGRAS